MILEIFDINGEYVKTVMGDEEQCLANMSEGETSVEVLEMRSHSLHNESAYQKSLKLQKVSEIKVTVNDKVFDGNEISQDRMARVIAVGKSVVVWRLADNTEVEVTIDELKKALSLASAEVSKILLDA